VLGGEIAVRGASLPGGSAARVAARDRGGAAALSAHPAGPDEPAQTLRQQGKGSAAAGRRGAWPRADAQPGGLARRRSAPLVPALESSARQAVAAAVTGRGSSKVGTDVYRNQEFVAILVLNLTDIQIKNREHELTICDQFCLTLCFKKDSIF
jgi:hypothetical protein